MEEEYYFIQTELIKTKEKIEKTAKKYQNYKHVLFGLADEIEQRRLYIEEQEKIKEEEN